MQTKRVFTYIDGQNLYYGLKSHQWLKYMWLDIERFSRAILMPGDEIRQVKYFSVRVSHPEQKCEAFKAYHLALGTLPSVHLFYGKLGKSRRKCPLCGTSCVVACPSCKWTGYEPRIKRVNENICIEMLRDALEDSYDKAYLVSSNNDLILPIQAIKHSRPQKEIILAIIPKRGETSDLQKAADGSFHVNEATLKQNQLSNQLYLNSRGFTVSRPEHWM